MRALARGLVGSVASVVGLLALMGCGTGVAMAPESSASAGRPPFRTTTPGPVTPGGTATPVPAVRWAAIVADLADRGITAEPAIVSAEDIIWPNGALGCPQPGRSYTQALVEGMRVIVNAGGTSYDYRFGSGDMPTLCPR